MEFSIAPEKLYVSIVSKESKVVQHAAHTVKPEQRTVKCRGSSASMNGHIHVKQVLTTERFIVTCDNTNVNRERLRGIQKPFIRAVRIHVVLDITRQSCHAIVLKVNTIHKRRISTVLLLKNTC